MMESIREEQLDKYILELEAALKNDNQNEEIKKMCDNQRDWLGKVEKLLVEKKYELAEQLFYGVLLLEYGEINMYWLYTESAILDWMFQVHKAEVESGIDSIFNKINKITDMKDFYYELKFLIRRFEFDFPTELKESILEFIARYAISEIALIQMIKACVINKEKVYNELAVFLMENGKFEYTIPLLSEALKCDNTNQESLFNISYGLMVCDEYELAEKYIAKMESNDSKKLLMEAFETRELKSYRCLHEMTWEQKEKPVSLSIPEKQEKIAFIICVNKERFLEECSYYIKQLEIPSGYTVEIVPIYNAKSITSGYQKGMKQTDARYKIYIHQDAMCIHKNMLYEALHVFQQDEKIGLIGVAGCKVMPVSGIWWEAEMRDCFYNLYQDSVASFGCENYYLGSKEYENGDYQCVMALDGVFLMTSKDIDWREDLFQGWHIYDVSQCMEFIRNGYKVAIPKTKDLWILHDEKYQTHLEREYHQARLDYLKEYRKELIQLV